MRVPEEAGLGKATMTMTFGAWKEGRVRPATTAVTVEEKAAKK